MNKWVIGCGVVLIGVVLIFGLGGVGSYNSLVKLDQSVQAQWRQVESVYQRRADLARSFVEA